MDIRTIFKLIKHLTSQTNVNELVTALTELLIANFSGVQVVVYELHASRTSDSMGENLVCIDCLQEKSPVVLDEDKALLEAYATKKEVHAISDDFKSKIIIPVVLYDKSVSHLILVMHPYNEDRAIDLLLGLMNIFSDVFRNLHEKGYDPLTRIFNRQAFDQVVSNLAFTHKKPDGFSSFDKHFSAIAILDIDKFKSINDQFGHAIGDETLVLFAQTIRSVLRQEDLFFRYGGEEFVILVKEVDYEQAHNVLERCREAIEKRRFPQVGDVTVSIGFSDLEPDAHPLESLSKADKALYYIKHHGRNQVHSYEHLLSQNLLEPVAPNEGGYDFWDI